MTTSQTDNVVSYWLQFVAGKKWRDLVADIRPKQSGCGALYELPAHSKPGEELCIADMRALTITEPHHHPDNNYEIYIGMEGLAKLMVGYTENQVSPARAVVIPPNHAHYAIPDEKFVAAVINIPGYTNENYIVTTISDARVKFDLNQFRRLEQEGAHMRAMR